MQSPKRTYYSLTRHIMMLLGMFLIIGNACATHIVGGEISYTYIGPGTFNTVEYEVTLTVYRDCGPTNINGTNFDPDAFIGIFDAVTYDFEENYDIPLSFSNVEEIPVSLDNPCFTLPDGLCVEKAVYTTTIFVPINPNGYVIVYQRCCRNPSIVNLNNPDDSGVTFMVTIPGTSDAPGMINSSAVFNNFPPVALCAGAEFEFNHGATDADGDSLSYEFCSPFLGASPDDPAPTIPSPPPYTNVSWANGYSSGNQIASNPAFQIDPFTGVITGTANQVGQYVIGICVSEYRDGVLINTSNRDFQFNVTICDPNIIATIPQQTTLCDGLTVEFNNNSTNATFFQWDFGVPNIDTDVSTQTDPSFTYPEPGDYSVMLIANPGWPCADTAISAFDVRLPLEPIISLDTALCAQDQVRYDFNSNGNLSTTAQFSWDFGLGATPSSSTNANPSGIILNAESSSYTVSFTVIDNGCTDQAILSFNNIPEPIATIIPQETFCAGLTYTFEQNSQNATTYGWDFGVGGSNDLSDLESPTFTFPDTGLYVVRLVASSAYTCPDTAFTTMDIYELLQPYFDPQDPQCFDTHSFDFFAEGSTTENSVFSWTFGPLASVPSTTTNNPQNITFSASGTYPVTLTISENNCERNYTDEVWVPTPPTINPQIIAPEGCPVHLASFEANGSSETPMAYMWDFGDGETAFAGTTSHNYETPGYYDISLTAMTTTGCVRTLNWSENDGVIVYPFPTASFTTSASEADILNPQITITSTATDATSCYFSMGDGGFSEECEFEYNFQEAGYQSITQVVTNSFGCTDRLEGRVFISGMLFYAPASFSPNNDGLNDYWWPVMTGVTSMECVIYDRWGTKVFESNNIDDAWIGSIHGGENYAMDGVYHYHIRLKDLGLYSHEYQGHITIIR